MINTWFTSDSHFGHKKILEYERESRPFESLEEMQEVMIDRWNQAVNCNDIVYHLGDFCFGHENIAIAERLNGKKYLVLGNHDTYPSTDYLHYFDRLFGVTYWKMCILTHVPVHPNQLGSRALLNVHGHLHSKNIMIDVDEDGMYFPDWKIEDKRYVNVSCEQNNLTPIHADQILSWLNEIKNGI